MKNRWIILLCLSISIISQAHALPPVIDNSSYPGASGPANAVIPATPSNTAMLELMTRIERLQTEVRQLTGKVEEQTNQISELKKQQKTLSADFDERLLNLENKATATDTAAENAELPIDAVEDDRATSDTTPPTGVETDTATTPGQDQPAARQPQSQATPVSDGEKQAYQQAYQLLRHGHTDQAITEFKAFLDQYPDSGLANNAQYWLGEAYRVKRDDNAARNAFNEVINKYPKGAKVPDALLKLGYIAIEQNQPEQAREYLNRIVNDYPNTQTALLAERKLATLTAN